MTSSDIATYRLTWRPDDAGPETLTVRMPRPLGSELQALVQNRTDFGGDCAWIDTRGQDGRFTTFLYRLARITDLTEVDATTAGTPQDRDVSQRVTEEWFVQSLQPDSTWERSSSQPTVGLGLERLAALQRRFPDARHRLRHRTTTVVDQTVHQDDDTPFDHTPGNV